MALRDAFIWYDYFGIPQIVERTVGQDVKTELQNAVDSIPAYVEKSSYFFILAPFGGIKHFDSGRFCDYVTWLSRGWCRLEQASRALSVTETCVHLIVNSTLLEEKYPFNWVHAVPRTGCFTVESDREVVEELMGHLVEAKLLQWEQGGPSQLLEWRFLRALQPYLGKCTRRETSEMTEVQEWLQGFAFRHAQDTGPRGWGPPHFAALEANTTILKQLLAARVEVDQKTTASFPRALGAKGMTPLMIAAKYNPDPDACVATLEFLLQQNADVHYKDKLGQTALHWASQGVVGTAAIEMLLQARADVLACDALQQNALQLAGNHCFMNYAVLDRLLALRADPHSCNANGQNILTQIAPGLNADRVSIAADAGVDVCYGCFTRPREWPARRMFKLAKRVAKSPNVDFLVDSLGNSPLHECARLGNKQAIPALLAARADAEQKNLSGKTPADLAKELGPDADEVLRLLSGAEAQHGQGGTEISTGHSCADVILSADEAEDSEEDLISI